MRRPHPRSMVKDLQSRAVMRWPSLSYGILPLVILTLTIIASLIGYSLALANMEGSRGRSTARTSRENNLKINGVFDSYAHVLWGSTGRVQSSTQLQQDGTLDESSWRKFIDVYNLSENFSGMEAIGLVYSTNTADAPISYVSPSTDMTNKAIGYNLALIPELKEAMDEAAKSGRTVASGAIPNLFSTKKDVTSKQTGFLMFAPFYDQSMPTTDDNQRVQALRGFTVAAFRGDIFFNQIYSGADLSHTMVQVFLNDGEKQNLLYGAGTITTTDYRTITQQITEYGKTFTVKYTFDTLYILVWSLTYFPMIILVSGLALGMLFAGVAGYLLRSRYHRLTYEKERDVNFAKDELLSLASHQLRTPATGVKQYLGMVLQGFAGDLTDQQRAYLERAYASNNRQLHVINDILHLAKLEAGRIVLAEREFNLAEMTKEIVDEQQDEAKKGEITLRYTGPGRGLMMGDSHMLRMVIENLVNNAVKYTPPGGKVDVRLTRLGNTWVIAVKDTGVGIAKADFSKLFQQFSRIENARSESVTGTGIGLYLAHHLTLLHGGTIGVTSTKNKGTTFTVRLPRKL